MHDSERIVVFAGAGFSVPVGIPAMDIFIDEMRSSHLNPQEIRQLDGILKECASKASLINENIRNLEVLSSFVSMIKFTDPDFVFLPGDDALTVIEAEQFLSRAIARVSGVRLKTSGVNSAAHLLEHFAREDSLSATIITTNYDMHFETASLMPFTFSPLASGLRIDLPGVTIANQNSIELMSGSASMYTESDGAPLLIKMHGSVNWFRSGQETNVDASIRAHPWGPDDRGSLEVGYWDFRTNDRRPRPLSWDGEVLATNDSLLMLPTVLKPESDPLIKHQWMLAADAISNADQVWFIGYSFPESDSYMRYFLATCMAKNTRIRQIAIINPDRSVYFDKAMNVFADARLQSIMKLYPYKVQEVEWASVRKMDSLHRLRTEQDIRRAELEMRSNRVLMGEYFEELDGQNNSSFRYRGRDRGRGRIGL